MVTMQEYLSELPPEDRRQIEEMTRALRIQYESLEMVRCAIERAQASLGERLGVNQEDISHLEQPSDLLLSTLSRCIAEQGGRLSMVVEYPDRPPVALTDIRALEDDYHEPDDADFLLSSLPKDWAERAEMSVGNSQSAA